MQKNGIIGVRAYSFFRSIFPDYKIENMLLIFVFFFFLYILISNYMYFITYIISLRI